MKLSPRVLLLTLLAAVGAGVLTFARPTPSYEDQLVGVAVHRTMVRQRIVILHGFVKKSDKAPARELDLARDRMKQVLRHE